MNYSQVNEEALKRRAKHAAQKKAAEDFIGGNPGCDQDMKAGKIYMDGKPYDSMEDLFFKGFSKDEQDIMLGKNPFVKVRY